MYAGQAASMPLDSCTGQRVGVLSLSKKRKYCQKISFISPMIASKGVKFVKNRFFEQALQTKILAKKHRGQSGSIITR
jgi:hypothetical protein